METFKPYYFSKPSSQPSSKPQFQDNGGQSNTRIPSPLKCTECLIRLRALIICTLAKQNGPRGCDVSMFYLMCVALCSACSPLLHGA